MRFILAAALCAVALPCHALTLHWNSTRTDVTLSGMIEVGDSARIINAISASSAPPHYIHLNSKGGDLGEARELVRFVQAWRFRTVAEEVCASACFAVFMAGTTRTVMPGTRIGIHSASAWNAATGKWDHRDGQATAALARLYKTLGVPDYLVELMTATPPHEMYYLTASDLEGVARQE